MLECDKSEKKESIGYKNQIKIKETPYYYFCDLDYGLPLKILIN